MPVTFSAGVKFSLLPTTVTVPKAGLTIVARVIVRGLPSRSTSLPMTLIAFSAVFIGVFAKSLTATGGSLTGTTRIVVTGTFVKLAPLTSPT